MDVCLRSMGGIGCVISDHDRGVAAPVMTVMVMVVVVVVVILVKTI